MHKVQKFWIGEREQAIVEQVAQQFEGNASWAIRHMIREYARLHMTVAQMAALVAEDEATDAREMVK